MSTIYLLEAEHWDVPGRLVQACGTEETAHSKANKIVSLMLDQSGLESTGDWRADLAACKISTTTSPATSRSRLSTSIPDLNEHWANTMAGTPSLFDEITAPSVRAASRQPGKPPVSPLRPDGQFGCSVCGGPTHFGFGVKLRAGRPGRWACRQHIDEVKNGGP